jgi:hypothetical protein
MKSSAMLERPYSQHFIFFVTYESAQQTRVLHYIRLKRLARENTIAYSAHSLVTKKM